MNRADLQTHMRRIAEYFGLGQPIAEEAAAHAGRLEAQVEALERRVAQNTEDIERLRAEVIRLHGKL